MRLWRLQAWSLRGGSGRGGRSVDHEGRPLRRLQGPISPSQDFVRKWMILAAVLAVPLLCCLVIVVAFYQSRYGVPATKTYEGRLASGATYIIQVPDRWN